MLYYLERFGSIASNATGDNQVFGATSVRSRLGGIEPQPFVAKTIHLLSATTDK